MLCVLLYGHGYTWTGRVASLRAQCYLYCILIVGDENWPGVANMLLPISIWLVRYLMWRRYSVCCSPAQSCHGYLQSREWMELRVSWSPCRAQLHVAGCINRQSKGRGFEAEWPSARCVYLCHLRQTWTITYGWLVVDVSQLKHAKLCWWLASPQS